MANRTHREIPISKYQNVSKAVLRLTKQLFPDFVDQLSFLGFNLRRARCTIPGKEKRMQRNEKVRTIHGMQVLGYCD